MDFYQYFPKSPISKSRLLLFLQRKQDILFFYIFYKKEIT